MVGTTVSCTGAPEQPGGSPGGAWRRNPHLPASAIALDR
jgi:hypothetical protein